MTRSGQWLVPIAREQLKKFTKVPRGKDSLQLRHVRQIFLQSSMTATVSAKKIVLERDGKSFSLNANGLLRDRLCSIFKESL